MKRMFTKNEIKEIAKEASGDVIEVSNITSISTKILNNLKAGDVVVKKTGNMKHSYRVSYKEKNQGICLTYTDASIAETVSYDFNTTTKKWVYNSTDVTELNSGGSGDSTLLVEVDMQGGTLTSDVLTALLAKPYNVVFTSASENGTVYLKPIMISPSQTDLHFGFDTQAQMEIRVVIATGEYTFVIQ